MGRKSQSQILAATSWLPGFEPDGQESAHLAPGQLLITPVAAPPPSPPSAVAAANALAGFGVAATAAIDPIVLPDPRQALEVHGSEDLETPDEAIPAESTVLQPPAQEVATKEWPVFDSTRLAPPSGEEKRIKSNLHAIRLCKQLRDESAEPTDSQRHELLTYVGWGGLARIFENLDRNPLKRYHDQLEALLTPEEFASARASTTDAFYTDPVVVEAMWDTVKRMGFKGGRIIEPTAGTGMFLVGMPVEIAQKSEVTAVEVDTVSGAILETVFGGLGVQTHIDRIEKAKVPHGFYDLAISNVPFGEQKTLECRKVGYADWSLHNYVFGKAIDLVRPGGLVVFVTSRFTLDSQTRMHRTWLNAHAELLGAIRLPQNAFRKQAGTDVVTDIIVLRKRAAPVFSSKGDWIELGTAPMEIMRPGQSLQDYSSHTRGYVDKPRTINAYYEKHPGMVVGQLEFQSGRYRQDELLPVFAGDAQQYKARLAECVQAMPADVYEDAKAEPEDELMGMTGLLLQRTIATHQVRPGSFVLHNGAIHISEGASWIDVDAAYKGAARQRLLGMMKLRDAARALLEQQATATDDAAFKSLQFKLNTLYDAFVAKYGHMSDRANLRGFRSDPECPLILSLEQYDEDAEVYRKADIFSKRTVGHREPPATVETARDAMLVSLAMYGRIVLPDMAKRLQVSSKAVVQSLVDEALAYLDPDDGKWRPADEYLSGHIRNKIATAKAAGAKYLRNVVALTAVLPKDLGPGEVEVRLGAPWVPADVLGQFLDELIGLKAGTATVQYDAQSATWSVNTGSYRPEWAGDRTLNTAKWGTADRCGATLMENALNQTPPKITRTVDNKSVIDRQATLAAREKYEAIKVEFKQWAYRDEARRDKLLRLYNDEFNQIVERKYDGSHLLLPGMSKVIDPYVHQLNAIWRIVSGGNTLLAHAVGAGKTFTMAAAAMEMRRIGKAVKPCMVVPNHLLYQFTADVVRFYPNAKVLMATKDDLSGDKRREFTARIATGDWDAVIMTHSTFERLPLRPTSEQRFVQQLIDQARLAMDMANEAGSKRTVKQCEKLIKVFEAKIERAMNEAARDEFVYWDDLGIDFVEYDEAHAAKNLLRISKMPTIAGLPNASSNRAFDLWMKTSLIMEQRGDKEEGVVLSTATPISNSLAEMHVVQKYLQPYTLKQHGLYEFDSWAGTFGESVQGMEIAPDGSGYRLHTRFSRFVNVADMMAIFRCVADIQTKSMIKLPAPRVKGGKAQVIASSPSAELKACTEELVQRAIAIRNRSVRPEEDNMLAVTHAGRMAALDMRLITPALPFDPNGKVARCRDEVVRIWKETHERKGTQIVFCDMSTPHTHGFSVYQDLRDQLVAEGIPRGEIEFIHDHDSDSAKETLFKKVRAGAVRVLMGSTQKLGVGTNVQRRLKCVHGLDVPWRPSDIEQRDGRGERPGNSWDEIELLRYVTTGSFDAYIWSLVEGKARFIEQVMTSTAGMRTVEDLTIGALSYAEIKAIASGNPVVLEKATVDAQVLRFSVLQDQWEQDRWIWSRRRSSNAVEIDRIEKHRESDLRDAQAIAAEAEKGWTFQPAGKLCEAAMLAVSAAVQIGAQVHEVHRRVKMGEAVVGVVGGMNLVLSRFDGVQLHLASRSDSKLDLTIDRRGVFLNQFAETGELVIERLRSLIDLPERKQARLMQLRKENEDLGRMLEIDFEHGDKLKDLVARQREIELELDLDKSEAGTEAAPDSGAVMETVA